MIRFSSIFKGNGEEKKEANRPEKIPPVKKELKTASPEVIRVKEEVSPSKTVPESLDVSRDVTLDAKKIYKGLIDFSGNVVNRLSNGNKVSYKEVSAKVREMAELLKENKHVFGDLTNSETPENYIVAHQINVSILALQIGIELGYLPAKLQDLGVASLLFDVGMMKVMEIAKQKRKLGEDEFDEIKNHTQYGVQMLKQFTDFPQSIIDVAAQHHERPDGKGYPLGLKGREISELSKIISVADIYIALTHARPERKGLSPHEAIKELLQNASLFSPNILRSLLSVISIYPVGTWIELNSHDVGKVVELNVGQPLRPVVELVCDHRGRPLEKVSRVDLIQQPQLYITNVVETNDVEKWGFA